MDYQGGVQKERMFDIIPPYLWGNTQVAPYRQGRSGVSARRVVERFEGLEALFVVRSAGRSLELSEMP